MLRIRRKQLAQLDAQARADFVARTTPIVVAWRAPRFAGADTDAVARWVDGQINRAEAFGLDDERRLLAWLEVAAAHGDDLAEDAFVVHLLHEKDALENWPATRDVIDLVAEAMADPERAASEDAT